MAGIEKSIELYELILARVESSGVAPHQTDYYRRCLDLIKTCSTLEEAELAMRNSPLYTQGGQAVMLDKFIAFIKAMEYCRYPEAAKIYRDKYEEVKDNYASAWDTSYVSRVTEIITEYTERKGLFTKIALAPVNYMGASELPTDRRSRKMDDDALKSAFSDLSAKGLDFFEMAADPIYRELLPVDDAEYSKYIAGLRDFMNKGTMAVDDDPEEYTRIRNFVNSNKDALLAVCANVKTKKAVVLAVPDEAAPFKYDFIDRAEEV